MRTSRKMIWTAVRTRRRNLRLRRRRPRRRQRLPNRKRRRESVSVTINGNPMILKGKDDGEPYYLMDLLQYSGLDLEHLRGPVDMLVNGFMGQFTQRILSGDNVVIRYRDE